MTPMNGRTSFPNTSVFPYYTVKELRVTGPKLRALSKTHLRSANLALNKSEGKNLCHKVPNSILTTAHNNTDDHTTRLDW
eukprot:1332724-Amorphochlora_amoeboformis.AAC.1